MHDQTWVHSLILSSLKSDPFYYLLIMIRIKINTKAGNHKSNTLVFNIFPNHFFKLGLASYFFLTEVYSFFPFSKKNMT